MYNKHSNEKYGEAHYERAAEVLPSVGKFMKHLFKLSCWALQSSPWRYQCEKTKLSESVARPALANQIEDEK